MITEITFIACFLFLTEMETTSRIQLTQEFCLISWLIQHRVSPGVRFAGIWVSLISYQQKSFFERMNGFYNLEETQQHMHRCLGDLQLHRRRFHRSTKLCYSFTTLNEQSEEQRKACSENSHSTSVFQKIFHIRDFLFWGHLIYLKCRFS